MFKELKHDSRKEGDDNDVAGYGIGVVVRRRDEDRFLHVSLIRRYGTFLLDSHGEIRIGEYLPFGFAI
jgi:hypothetical protein